MEMFEDHQRAKDVLIICIILSGILFILAFWLIYKNENKFDTSLLGLVTLATAVLLFGIIQPDKFKLAGLEATISSRVEKIENNLRPYAIIDPAKKELVKQTFRTGVFRLVDFQKAVEAKDRKTTLKFWLKYKPSFLEVRSNGGKVFNNSSSVSEGNGYLYVAQLDVGFYEQQHDLNPYGIIIEAYLEKEQEAN